MLRRLLVIAGFVGLTATAAVADRDAWRAGREGTVTAYEADGRTVIENKECFRTRRHGGYDYSSCSDRLRTSVKIELCRKNRGGGTQTWFYQIGNNRPVRTSVYCGRRY